MRPSSPHLHQVARWAGALLFLAALAYPFESPPAPNARAHVFATGALALAAAGWGLGRTQWRAAAVLVLFGGWVFLHGGAYDGAALLALGMGALGFLGFHCGAHMRKGAALPVFLVCLLAAAFVNAIEGLLQFYGLGWHLYPWVVESMQRGVAYGAFKQRNVFAILLVVGTVAAAWLRARGSLSAGMAWLACAILQLAIVASGSRIALVGVLAVAAGALLLRRSAPAAARLLMLQPLAYLAAVPAVSALAHLHGFDPAGIAVRVANAAGDSRLQIWRDAGVLVLARPWAGWGWGEFGFGHYETLIDGRFGRGVETLSHAHNLLLQVAVEGGLPLAIVLTAALVLLAVRAIRSASKAPEALLAALMLLPLVLHSMVELPLWWPSHLFIAACALGYLAEGRDLEGAARQTSWPPVALALVLAAGCWEASRQYERVSRIYDWESRDRAVRARAIEAASDAILFLPYVDFARLAGVPVTGQNAAAVRHTALRLVHFSAEPFVIARLMEAAWELGLRDEVLHHATRFRTAFPGRYAAWVAEQQSQRPELFAWLEQGKLGTVEVPAKQ